MPRLSTTTAWVALVAAVMSSLLACSDSQDAADSEQANSGGLEDGAFERIDGMEATSGQNPITPEDFVVINNAEMRLIAACMRDEGFDYGADLGITETVAAPPLYLSPSALRRSGYQYDWETAGANHLALNGEDGPPNQTEGMSPEQVQAFGRALRGSASELVELTEPDGSMTAMSADGCEADASRELYGSVANYMRLMRARERTHLSAISDRLRGMDVYAEPLVAWQECMRAAGHDVSDENDYGWGYLRTRGLASLQGSGTFDADLVTAVAEADAECQESSGLYEVREELLPEVQDAVATDLGFEVSQYVAFQHALLERAQNVL